MCATRCRKFDPPCRKNALLSPTPGAYGAKLTGDDQGPYPRSTLTLRGSAGMRAVTYTVRDAVSAPVNQVFHVLTDPGGMAACFPGADAVQSTGPLAAGTSITVRFGERVTEFEVVAYTEPSTVGWVERGGRQGWRTVFNLDPAGAGTALTIRNEWAPHSLGAWLRGRWFGKREVEQHLERILDNVLHALFRERPSF